MELTLEEKIVLELIRRRKSAGRRVDKMSIEKLVFLVAHGEFSEKGDIEGLRAFPRIDVDYRVYFRGVHSRDVYEILERLAEKKLVVIRDKEYDLVVDKPIHLPRSIEILINYVEKYISLSSRELERFTNTLLGIKDEATKALVFNTSVVKLLKAKEEARRLREQGLLVDV